MPHKRAKLSARQSDRAKRGTDLPPMGGVPLAQENVPKSMTRVLQAEGVRKAYRAKRTRSDDALGVVDGGRASKRRRKDGETQKPSGIKYGESLAQYNRRVEDEMRIPVAEAMQTSRSTAKRAYKSDKAAKALKASKTTASPSNTSAPKAASNLDGSASSPPRKTEFDQRAPTTRLNDIVQAPPDLTRLPRGAAKRTGPGSDKAGKIHGVVSMAQKQMMEDERERAIKRYRELKELRAAA